MAPLPKIHLQMTTKPFANCAVDFGGPYLTIQVHGRSRAKHYLCLFLRVQTHCCHLEMATSLDTGAFLNAFIRMAARRGWPTKMLSDNGRNFMGAEKEIRDLVSQLDHGQLQRMTSNYGVTWCWNPLAAPHFGGVFESMIKSSKRAICRSERCRCQWRRATDNIHWIWKSDELKATDHIEWRSKWWASTLTRSLPNWSYGWWLHSQKCGQYRI